MDPLVSIGMPVFNCAGLVEQAICSIVNQTFEDWELIIIDDGSEDNTFEIAASFDDPRIIVINGKENKRLPARLNECVSRSKGRYFARMDGDDIAYPHRLQCQLAFLESHPEVDLVGGQIVVFRNDGRALGARRCPLTHEQLCAHPRSRIPLHHPTWIGKIEWFRSNHYALVAASEDQELLCRTYRESIFASVPEVVLGYREDGMSLPYLLFQRWYQCKRMVWRAVEERQFTTAAFDIGVHAAKGLTETIAICSGLNYRILRHRATAINREEEREWRSVWGGVRLASDKHRSNNLLQID